MWKVTINFPFMDEELVFYFNTLNQASKELDLTTYFLRQVYYKKHRNQFAKFFSVTPVARFLDEQEKENEYDDTSSEFE